MLVASGHLSLLGLDTLGWLPKCRDGASGASASGAHRSRTQEPHEKPCSHHPRVDHNPRCPPAMGTSAHTLSTATSFTRAPCRAPSGPAPLLFLWDGLFLSPQPTCPFSPWGPPSSLACSRLLSAAVLPLPYPLRVCVCRVCTFFFSEIGLHGRLPRQVQSTSRAQAHVVSCQLPRSQTLSTAPSAQVHLTPRTASR